MDVRVIEGLDPVLRSMLLDHEIDLCISTLPRAGTEAETAAIAVVPLFQARMVAVVRRGHRLAGLSDISVGALSEELFITPPSGSAFRTAIDALFTVYGVPFPPNLVQVEVFGVIKEILKRSNGITLVSDQIVMSDLTDGSLVRIPLREQMAPRLFGGQYLKNGPHNPFLADCIEILRRTADVCKIPTNDCGNPKTGDAKASTGDPY